MRKYILRVLRALYSRWILVRVRMMMMGSLILFLGVCIFIFERLVYKESHEQLSCTLESFAQKFSQTLEMLDVDLRQLDSAHYRGLRELFRDPMYGATGYPFVIQMTGQINFHFFRDGDRLSREVLDQMASAPSRRGRIRVNFGETSETEKDIIFTFVRDLDCFLAIEVSDKVFDGTMNGLRVYSWLFFLLGSLLVWFILSYNMRKEGAFYKLLHKNLSDLAVGILPSPMPVKEGAEMRGIATSFNLVVENLATTTSFVQRMAENDLTSEYTPLGLRDELGNTLLALRSNLQKQELEAAHIKEEERIRSWSNEGLAEFAKLLRENNNDTSQLVEIVLQKVVNYLDATQGGLFIAEERKTGTVLHLAAAFAYNRKKYMQQDLALGEGLVGTCAIEREIVHIDVLPPEYCDITSGIGNTPPKELLIVPLKTDDALLGVLELASLKGFAPYMVNFAQLLSVSIAQTLQQAQSTQRTAELLRQSQEQREAMRSQEEEMRQNLEEMQATQEEMTRRTQEFEVLQCVVDSTLYYAEFGADGRYIQGNRRLEEHFHQLGIADFSELSFFSLIDWTPVDSSQHGYTLEDLWRKISSGISHAQQLSLKGDSAAKLYCSFAVLSSDGVDHIYMIGQEMPTQSTLS